MFNNQLDSRSTPAIAAGLYNMATQAPFPLQITWRDSVNSPPVAEVTTLALIDGQLMRIRDGQLQAIPSSTIIDNLAPTTDIPQTALHALSQTSWADMEIMGQTFSRMLTKRNEQLMQYIASIVQQGVAIAQRTSEELLSLWNEMGELRVNMSDHYGTLYETLRTAQGWSAHTDNRLGQMELQVAAIPDTQAAATAAHQGALDAQTRVASVEQVTQQHSVAVQQTAQMAADAQTRANTVASSVQEVQGALQATSASAANAQQRVASVEQAARQHETDISQTAQATAAAATQARIAVSTAQRATEQIQAHSAEVQTAQRQAAAAQSAASASLQTVQQLAPGFDVQRNDMLEAARRVERLEGETKTLRDNLTALEKTNGILISQMADQHKLLLRLTERIETIAVPGQSAPATPARADPFTTVPRARARDPHVVESDHSSLHQQTSDDDSGEYTTTEVTETTERRRRTISFPADVTTSSTSLIAADMKTWYPYYKANGMETLIIALKQALPAPATGPLRMKFLAAMEDLEACIRCLLPRGNVVDKAGHLNGEGFLARRALSRVCDLHLRAEAFLPGGAEHQAYTDLGSQGLAARELMSYLYPFEYRKAPKPKDGRRDGRRKRGSRGGRGRTNSDSASRQPSRSYGGRDRAHSSYRDQAPRKNASRATPPDNREPKKRQEGRGGPPVNQHDTTGARTVSRGFPPLNSRSPASSPPAHGADRLPTDDSATRVESSAVRGEVEHAGNHTGVAATLRRGRASHGSQEQATTEDARDANARPNPAAGMGDLEDWMTQPMHDEQGAIPNKLLVSMIMPRKISINKAKIPPARPLPLMLEALHEQLTRGLWSATTYRLYQSIWNRLIAFCRQADLPLGENSAALFVNELQVQHATKLTYCTQLTSLFSIMGLPHVALRTLAASLRGTGALEPTRQANPIGGGTPCERSQRPKSRHSA